MLIGKHLFNLYVSLLHTKSLRDWEEIRVARDSGVV